MDSVSLPAWVLPAWTALTAGAAGLLVRFLRRHPFRGGGVRPFPLSASDLAAFLCFVIAAAFLLGGFWFNGAACAGVLLLWGHREGAEGVRSRLGLARGKIGPLPALGLGLWIAAVVALPLQLFSSALGALFEKLHWATPLEPAVQLFVGAHGWRQLAGILGAALVLAPAAEEAFFRGFLQPVLKAHFEAGGERRAALAAGILSALAFAAIHAHLLTFLPLLAMGLVLALVHEWSGSLLLCMAVHFWFNLSTALVLLTGHSSL